MSGDLGPVQRLELAAAALLAPPGKVSEAERKAAESIFIELRESQITLQQCQQAFDSGTSDFVAFELVKGLRESTLREWSVLDSGTVEATWKWLVERCVQLERAAPFLTGEMLLGMAMILKRGIFDKKCGDQEEFLATIERLVLSPDSKMQALACRAIQTLCIEYCTAWRSGNVGITWDFHMRAKRAFESTGLKRLLQLALRVLHGLMTNSNDELTTIYQRFLALAETVLSWNFGSRMLPRRLTYSVEFGGSAAFRPPGSWKDIFSDENVFNFFFQLHGRVRTNESLCHQSMLCLTQLASLMGEVFQVVDDEKSIGRTVESLQDRFVSTFVTNTLRTFATEQGPLPFELYNCCVMLNKLLTYHPIPSFVRLPADVLSQFITFYVNLTVHLCSLTVLENVCSKSEDESQGKYHESVAKLYDAWTILARTEGRFVPEGSFRDANWQLFNGFFKAIISAPVGTRPVDFSKNGATDGDEIQDEIEQDDRELFADVLSPVGVCARACMADFVSLYASVFVEKLCWFISSVSSDNPTIDQSILSSWQEDMHWLLLVLGYTLTSEDADFSCYVHGEVYKYCEELSSTAKVDFASNNATAYMAACVTAPERVPAVLETDVDPIICLIGRVFQWASVQHALLTGNRMALISPQLVQTTLWCLRRLVTAFTASDEDTDSSDKGQSFQSVEETYYMPKLETGTPASQKLVDFLLQTCFACLTKLSGEGLMAQDATRLLVSLADTTQRANEVAHSDSLMREIGNVQLQQLSASARKALLRSLVLIGASTDDTEMQQRMYLAFLDPLAGRFAALSSALASSSVESDLVDAIDCFRGVAQAAQIHSAEFLFGYLLPVLQKCVELLVRYQDRVTVVDALLSLYLDVTKKLAIYVENQQHSEALFQCLLAMLRSYADSQVAKYQGKDVEEDKASDLILVMDILSNVLSKDVLVLVGFDERNDAFTSGAQVALAGLEITMPLMTAELLRFPSLCSRFYKLLLYFTEMYPDAIGQVPPPMLAALLECARLGLTSQYGSEVTQLCLEMVGQLATFAAQRPASDTFCVEFQKLLSHFMQPVFESCLHYSCEVDVFGDATNALYALICCDRSIFDAMAVQLINCHADAQVTEQLRMAFAQLLPDNASLGVTRKDRRQFRDRFEKFLNDIQGLLCLRH